jgi:hypothetical protein
MAGISNVQTIVAAIRAELALRQGATSTSSSPVPRKRLRGKAGAASLSADLIGARVQELDPTDPHRARKAFRIFLESVLLDELGHELINDSAFYRLVDQVQQTMEQDAPTAAAIDKAMVSLLGMQTTGR